MINDTASVHEIELSFEDELLDSLMGNNGCVGSNIGVLRTAV